MNVQSDRAEQAKALIAEIETRRGFFDNEYEKGSEIGLMFQAAAALTASEAEVTRLETGIAEALAILELPRLMYSTEEEHQGDQLYEVRRIVRALSQPTTDTNGAHA